MKKFLSFAAQATVIAFAIKGYRVATKGMDWVLYIPATVVFICCIALASLLAWYILDIKQPKK